MSGTGKALRVGILRLRCQEPRRYFVAVQSLPGSARPEQVPRTETSEPSRNPDFAASSFLLRLPLPLASLPPEQALLRLDLLSTPGLEPEGLEPSTGGQAGTLVASGLVGGGRLGPDAVSRLLQGQRVTLTVALEVEAEMGLGAATRGELEPGLPGLAPYEALLELQLLDAVRGGDPGVGAAGEAAEALLVQECLIKQAVVARVARQADASSARSEVLSWRLMDAEKRARSLLEENGRLQQQLQVEQQSWRIPQLRLLVESARLTREELIERCESVMAAYGRERVRNGELVERLKVLHAEQVDALELKKRYQQLQEAHQEQARTYSELDGEGDRLAQLRATVKTQEEIIRNLEALLAATVQKVKPRGQDAAAAKESRPPGAPLAADVQAAEQSDVARDGDAAGPDDATGLQSRLAAAEAQVVLLQQELADRQAEAAERQQRLDDLERELDALRSHTVTEFPALEPSAPDSEDRGRQAGAPVAEAEAAEEERVQQLQAQLQQSEAELDAARARILELEAAGEQRGKEAATEEELRKLRSEAAQLAEERTAAQLRAEYAEGAAEAAQSQLVEVTRKYAREIAGLKTQLAEKEAAMKGGFGGLDLLGASATRSDPPFPAGSVTAEVSAAGEAGRGAGAGRRSALWQGGLSRRLALAPAGLSGGEGAEPGEGLLPAEGGGEGAAGGPRPLVWMKSRRGRVSSRSSGLEAAAVRKDDEPNAVAVQAPAQARAAEG